jgi:hypothetical protein
MDEEAEARFKIIAKVYRGPEGGKPAFKTWQDAREINPTITLNEVRGWRKQNIQPKGQVWGKRNSYVAPNAYHEYQADLIFITEGRFENQEYEAGLTMIDVFSKFAVVLPIREKKAGPIMEAIFNAFEAMGKQPEILYTDNEGALNTSWVQEEFQKAGIQHITAGTAYFVERFNLTFKNRMADRLTKLLREKRYKGKQPENEKINYQWHDLIPFVLAEYNTTKHRITGLSPTDARKPSNEADVKASMELAATSGVKCPPLKVGDTVRMLKKMKLGEKEFMDAFKPGKQKVVEITENFGQQFYRLSDKREYIRSDLVKMIN